MLLVDNTDDVKTMPPMVIKHFIPQRNKLLPQNNAKRAILSTRLISENVKHATQPFFFPSFHDNGFTYLPLFQLVVTSFLILFLSLVYWNIFKLLETTPQAHLETTPASCNLNGHSINAVHIFPSSTHIFSSPTQLRVYIPLTPTMVDNCDMLLRAAELLDHTKVSHVAEPARVPVDDYAVPDTDLSFGGSSPPAFDDFDDEPMELEEDVRKRPRMAALKGSRSFLARDAIAHNSVEKRRRAYLASCYEGLKNSIPSLANSRASNVKVLRGGAALIKVHNALWHIAHIRRLSLRSVG